MKQRISTLAVTIFLGIMGLLTLFLSSSIIFDLFDIRSREGNYVLPVVWANFFSAILYLVTAAAFYQRKRWAAIPLLVSLGALVAGAVMFIIHVQSGGLYESRTIGALIFRVSINILLTVLVFYSQNRGDKPGQPVRHVVLALLPLVVLAASCTTQREHDDHARAKEAADSHAHDHATDGKLALDNGEKWKADDHTLASVGRMKAEVIAFDQSETKDYKALASALRKELDALVAGCTMKGPAHDALHTWLVPYTEQVKALATAGEDEGAMVVEKIKDLIETFEASFEAGS